MKRYVWQPTAFLIVGTGFYIYNGVVWHTWTAYLPHIIGYTAICAALAWALRRKEKYKEERQRGKNC